MNFKRLEHVKLNHLADECLALDGSNGSCHVLNEVAGWLLSICENQISLDRAVELAEQRYAIPPDIDVQDEISTCLTRMREKGIIEVC